MFWVRRLGGGAPNGVKFPGSSQSHAPLEMIELRSEEHIILPPFPNLNADFKNLFLCINLRQVCIATPPYGRIAIEVST